MQQEILVFLNMDEREIAVSVCTEPCLYSVVVSKVAA